MNNKVYINPNFNIPARNHSGMTNKKMHINPNFSQPVQQQNKPKIYFNPNFINSRTTNQNNPGSLVTNEIQSHSAAVANVASLTTQPAIASISKSRYTFVRHNTNQILNSKGSVRPITTVKISKYKSVALSSYKKNLDTAKISEEKKHKTYSCSGRVHKAQFPMNKTSNSQYITPQYSQQSEKHVNLKVNTGSKFVHKKNYHPSDSIRSVVKLGKNKLKINKHNLKKNNLPCPLFKKYGKCLRSMQGKCEFLHDKKHVSICRKFMKGICHDAYCLLSHDITTKKMPTCFFYLRGMCSRECCPYLHVKLNDKTKVCPEFLKGYCENGDKCLNRHIGIEMKHNKSLLRRSTRTQKNSKIKSKQLNVRKNENNEPPLDLLENNKTAVNENAPTTSNSDSRYYKDNIISAEDANESSEMIKPTRCKLGILPSFIKF